MVDHIATQVVVLAHSEADTELSPAIVDPAEHQAAVTLLGQNLLAFGCWHRGSLPQRVLHSSRPLCA